MAELLEACASNDTKRAMEILKHNGEELNINYCEVFGIHRHNLQYTFGNNLIVNTK